MGRLIRIGDALSQFWHKVIDLALWFDEDHCRNSYLNDVRYSGQLLSTHGRSSEQ